jgi:tetratricopeptide (TPR) repeat protein
MKRYTSIILFFASTLLFVSCKKDWLDIKPDKNLATPSTVEDVQALLDNPIMNSMLQGIQQQNEEGADNYYLTDAIWLGLSTTLPADKNAYIFAKTIFQSTPNVRQWVLPYQRIYYANVALDALPSIPRTPANSVAWNMVKGHALFIRAYIFSLLQELYGQPYNKTAAGTDLGIPLRLSSNLNEPTTRATVEQTFSQVISDLKEAVQLLPATVPYKTRPSQATAYALLSRVALIMGNYNDAAAYASQSISLSGQLVSYAGLNQAATFPLTKFNSEVLFDDVNPTSVFTTTKARIDSVLITTYDANDLRKTIFFKQQPGYNIIKCSYEGSTSFFCGIATDEVYLNRAEAYARTGKTDSAMLDLNKLLLNRWKQNMFTPLTAADAASALQLVLTERRKELPLRGIRWMDLRRLNKEAGFQTTIKRVVQGQTYTLEPNSPRYAYPIPDDIIQLTGIPQNER